MKINLFIYFYPFKMTSFVNCELLLFFFSLFEGK